MNWWTRWASRGEDLLSKRGFLSGECGEGVQGLRNLIRPSQALPLRPHVLLLAHPSCISFYKLMHLLASQVWGDQGIREMGRRGRSAVGAPICKHLGGSGQEKLRGVLSAGAKPNCSTRT